MKILKLAAAALIAVAAFVAPAAAEKIRFAVTDVEGVEQLQREYGAFVDELQKVSRCRDRVHAGQQSHRSR